MYKRKYVSFREVTILQWEINNVLNRYAILKLVA